MSVGDAPAGTIWISSSTIDSHGWMGQKTPWFVRRQLYKGPLLIRARRLDKVGGVRFAKVSGQHLRELRFGPSESNGIQGSYRFLASASMFRSSGCFGFQIDGTSFSNVVVMRVVDVP
jgi:hypothetical protein